MSTDVLESTVVWMVHKEVGYYGLDVQTFHARCDEPWYIGLRSTSKKRKVFASRGRRFEGPSKSPRTLCFDWKRLPNLGRTFGAIELVGVI